MRKISGQSSPSTQSSGCGVADKHNSAFQHALSVKTVKILISSISGTLMMTASSKLMSLWGQNFSEPQHLTSMLRRVDPLFSKQTDKTLAWIGHLGMGTVFSTAYVQLYEHNTLKPSFLNSVLLGALSGVIGAAIWKATFKLHPAPTSINPDNFYIQRIPAHVVFAVFATLGYRAAREAAKDHRRK